MEPSLLLSEGERFAQLDCCCGQDFTDCLRRARSQTSRGSSTCTFGNPMTIVFRIARLIALSLWVGGLVFFIFVAKVAFTTLPSPELAGLMVRGSLISLHHLGLLCGLAYLVFTLLLLATQRDTHPVRAVELLLVAVMLVLTAYSEFSIIPQMEAYRISVGGDITKVPPDEPARVNFEHLHKVSVRLESAVLLQGLALLGLAGVHGRDDYDRFA